MTEWVKVAWILQRQNPCLFLRTYDELSTALSAL